METHPTPSFRNLVGELLRRHRHGICAIRLKSGKVESASTGQWGPKVGLASLIQHRVCSSGSSSPTQATASPVNMPAGPVPSDQLTLPGLELASTEQLVEGMRGFPSQWILGLARPARIGDGLVPYVATQGSTLICAGLAALMSHSLYLEDRQRFKVEHPNPLDQPDEPRYWLTVIHELIESERTDQTWMLGLTRGLEYSWLAQDDHANDAGPESGDVN